MEPTTPWFLVGFISSVPWWELPPLQIWYIKCYFNLLWLPFRLNFLIRLLAILRSFYVFAQCSIQVFILFLLSYKVLFTSRIHINGILFDNCCMWFSHFICLEFCDILWPRVSIFFTVVSISVFTFGLPFDLSWERFFYSYVTYSSTITLLVFYLTLKSFNHLQCILCVYCRCGILKS